MRKSNAVLASYFVLVFLGGGVVGALSFRLYSAHTVIAKGGRKSPEEYRKHYLDEMKKRLNLDAGQLQKLNTVLDQTGEKYRAAREKLKPEMDAIQDEQTRQIDEFLNENQKKEYGKMREEREKHMQQTRRGAPGC
jgi:hypothetical protein